MCILSDYDQSVVKAKMMENVIKVGHKELNEKWCDEKFYFVLFQKDIDC